MTASQSAVRNRKYVPGGVSFFTLKLVTNSSPKLGNLGLFLNAQKPEKQGS